MSLTFMADLIGMLVAKFVSFGLLQQSQADMILNKFVMPIDDSMAL